MKSHLVFSGHPQAGKVGHAHYIQDRDVQCMETALSAQIEQAPISDITQCPANPRKNAEPPKKTSKIPAWILWLRCVLVRGGHRYGRWWWPSRDEAHCFCEECADMRTPTNRSSWLHRERAANANLPADFFAFHKDDLKHTVIIGPTRVGMSNFFNPFLHTKEDVDSTLKLLVQMSGGQIGECEEAKAREVLQAESTDKSDLCLLDIVEAFERTPELQEFAGRLRHYALPGAFGKYYSPEAGRHLSVEDVAELRLTDEEVSRIKSKQN